MKWIYICPRAINYDNNGIWWTLLTPPGSIDCFSSVDLDAYSLWFVCQAVSPPLLLFLQATQHLRPRMDKTYEPILRPKYKFEQTRPTGLITCQITERLKAQQAIPNSWMYGRVPERQLCHPCWKLGRNCCFLEFCPTTIPWPFVNILRARDYLIGIRKTVSHQFRWEMHGVHGQCIRDSRDVDSWWTSPTCLHQAFDSSCLGQIPGLISHEMSGLCVNRTLSECG